MSKTYNNIYVKRHHFTKSMKYYELRIYKGIYKEIALQYEKSVTCNISVSASSQCMMEVQKEVSDVPLDIGTKLSATSLENPMCHTDVDKEYTTIADATSGREQ